MGINKLALTQDEILRFHQVIEISEKELKSNPGGFIMNKGRIKKFKTDNNIKLKKVEEVIKHEENNKFLFTQNRSSQGASFIAHIRNAYVHHNISIAGNYFLLEDYKKIYKNKKITGTVLTAYGRIRRDLLFPLIDCMLEDRNENLKKMK